MSDRSLALWQRRLLPLMVGMLVVLTAFFFVASCLQLAFLQNEIRRGPQFFHEESWSLLGKANDAFKRDPLQAAELKALIALEWASLERNYHQASVLLLARIWMNYLGFVTGMTLALVGAAFVLGQLQMAQSDLSAQSPSLSIALKTSSPGLTLAVLGVALMLATILVHHPIETQDSSAYLRLMGQPVSGSTTAPTLIPPHSDSLPVLHAP